MKHLSPMSPKLIRDSRTRATVLPLTPSQKLRIRPKNDSIEDLRSFVPDWLTSNKDFVLSYKKMKHQVDINLADVCKRSHINRTKDEKKALLQWLGTRIFFEDMSKNVLKKVCDKLSSVFIKTGENSKQ
jgi:hypothetical protein